MYIQKISIKNYRNFRDFSMEFKKGLNVIIGANNSGKTGLLYAVRLLNEPSISVDDFNKNNLLNYKKMFLTEAPSIEIEFVIRHLIMENNTEDESIIRLLPFLGMDRLNETRSEDNGDYQYDVTAHIKAICSLDSKALGDYVSTVANVTDFHSYMTVLASFISKYSWAYYNGASGSEASRKEATGIFDIRFIGAERTSDAVNKEARREIDIFAKEQSNVLSLQQLRDNISKEMRDILKDVLGKLSGLFENENNEIGLARGNVSISHDLRPNVSVGESYVTEVRDTGSDYIIPLEYNGLGYNNLINIYMLIKLTEIRTGRDFRILCLEEPEAHLHPAMQYKLLKYLRDLDKADNLNQQIFITTHSSNISAVAGIDNMYMLEYRRSNGDSDCKQQSLAVHFADKAQSKEHLTKFLDVTRSDMLFADKVILVEGIAEKLLLPQLMENSGCSYEDEHISIVEIGGKHFEYFIDLFNGNTVTKKVLCITDKDFKWLETDGDDKTLLDPAIYNKYESPHIKKLTEKFPIDNLHIVTQAEGGSTFEDELFLTNIPECSSDRTTAIKLMTIISNTTISELLENHSLDYIAWNTNRPKAVDSIILRYLDIFNATIEKNAKHQDFYKRLFFAKIFLHYANSQKGSVALSILANEDIAKAIEVPKYIKEGLKWLLK